MKQQRRHLAVPALLSGSGGGIRTPDLWVMSPTSCRCSTPRRVSALRSRRGAIGRRVISRQRVGGVRGGLASRGVAPTVLSGAALGHDRVRDGTGWGQHALGHGHPAPPARRDEDAALAPRSQSGAAASGTAPLLAGRPRALHSPHITPHASVLPAAAGRGRRPGRDSHLPLARAAPLPPTDPGGKRPQEVRPRPLGRLGSSRLPAVHLPPINPVICRGSYLRKSGDARLGEGFPLRCFQRFARPDVATQRCRLPDNWHTSGSSSPVLSY